MHLNRKGHQTDAAEIDDEQIMKQKQHTEQGAKLIII